MSSTEVVSRRHDTDNNGDGDGDGDIFDNLLSLEEEYYREGYEAGVSDSMYAGMIEGKVFGIEKGYEKAIELARFQGRALVWQSRIEAASRNEGIDDGGKGDEEDVSLTLASVTRTLPRFAGGNTKRLEKHVETLLVLTDGNSLSSENTDEAVSVFDERLARGKAKVKVVANVFGESLSDASTMAGGSGAGTGGSGGGVNDGIEDATGLNARS